MHASNFEFKLISHQKEDFINGIKILMSQHQEKHIRYYVAAPGIFVAYLMPQTKLGNGEFLIAMNATQLAEHLWDWLQTQKPVGPHPDIDGSVEENGFILTSTSEWPCSFILQKTYTEYHK